MNVTSPGYSAAEALRSGGREPVRIALEAARQRTLAIADAYSQALGGNEMRVAYDPNVNPPLWELGHIAWFQEYWIARNRQRSLGVDCAPDHPRASSWLDRADEFYDSSRVAHKSRWGLGLPDAAQTRAYLSATFSETLELLSQLSSQPTDAELYFFRLVALHEEMHAEAACYMARGLGVPLELASGSALSAGSAVLKIPAQTFQLGSHGPGFAFDNELHAHEIQLEKFEIDAQPVSSARFSDFIEAGGYQDKRWWSDEGLAWLKTWRAKPHTQDGGPYAPAMHLCAYEAEAWCRWAGRRLPTEAEWECAALTVPGFSWGQVWEWTASTFNPYSGFQPHPYRDYSMPWFGSRRVLRGACPATSPSLAHPRYRNFFEPSRKDLFAGFRSCA